MKVERTMIKLVQRHADGADAWIIEDCSGDLGQEIATSPAELIGSVLSGAGIDVSVNKCEEFISDILRD